MKSLSFFMLSLLVLFTSTGYSTCVHFINSNRKPKIVFKVGDKPVYLIEGDVVALKNGTSNSNWTVVGFDQDNNEVHLRNNSNGIIKIAHTEEIKMLENHELLKHVKAGQTVFFNRGVVKVLDQYINTYFAPYKFEEGRVIKVEANGFVLVQSKNDGIRGEFALIRPDNIALPRPTEASKFDIGDTTYKHNDSWSTRSKPRMVFAITLAGDRVIVEGDSSNEYLEYRPIEIGKANTELSVGSYKVGDTVSIFVETSDPNLLEVKFKVIAINPINSKITIRKKIGNEPEKTRTVTLEDIHRLQRTNRLPYP